MKIVIMDFNREQAEQIVAMAMDVPTTVTKAMTDEELIEKAFNYVSVYGFSNMKIVEDWRICL